MHGGSKGKSGSKKPSSQSKKSWIIHSGQEVEQLVVKLAKTGKSAALIGLILRDTYGIPSVKTLTGKKIQVILEKNKLLHTLPDDLQNLIRKDIQLAKHALTHKKDMTVKRGLQLTLSKINRLSKYYKNTDRLPKEWKYDRTKAKTLLE